ncbi:MAG: hypothetical protein ACRD27_02310, partial [Terracidiphilus sp.]
MPENDPLDHLIDSALSNYADPIPEPELAQRILARISAEATPAPRRRWLTVGLILPIALPAACAILLILTHPRPRIAKPQSGPANETAQFRNPAAVAPRIGSQSAPRTEAAYRTRTPAPNPRPIAVAAKSQPLPKLDVFPTPEPLSSQ